jgi:hypothetical protein
MKGWRAAPWGSEVFAYSLVGGHSATCHCGHAANASAASCRTARPGASNRPAPTAELRTSLLCGRPHGWEVEAGGRTLRGAASTPGRRR